MDKQPYFSYLLRMQRIQDSKIPVWLFSLVSPITGEPLRLEGIDDLMIFLLKQMEQSEHVAGGKSTDKP